MKEWLETWFFTILDRFKIDELKIESLFHLYRCILCIFLFNHEFDKYIIIDNIMKKFYNVFQIYYIIYYIIIII